MDVIAWYDAKDATHERFGGRLMKTIRAIFEHGVFRPTEPVDLPDHCTVEFEVRAVAGPEERPSLDDVYDILGNRFDTGEADIAARHDEHQP